jgi:uncharacterized protein YecE (DUF72 family)
MLGDRLGLILLQLAPSTKYNPDLLRSTIQSFGNPRKLAIEFRNNVWLSDEVHAMLSEYGVVYCNVDSPKSTLNDWVTSDIAYFRLHGRGKWYSYNYSEKELEEISRLAKNFAGRGIKSIYIFFNNDFEGYAPANASLIMDLLGVSPRHS